MKSFSNFFGEARTKAGKDAEKKGLVHTGKGYYADKTGAIVAKAEGGERLVNLSAKEKDSLKNGSALMPPQSAADVDTMQQMASGLQSVKGGQEQPAPKEEPKAKKEKGDEEEPLVPRNEGGGEVVITFGRFNPPHVGHEKLINRVADEAQSSGADYMIYPSHSNDPKKNPLDFGTKLNAMQHMFPSHASNIANDPQNGRNIFDVLKNLHAQGYDSVKVVVGDDRVKEFTNMTSKYNGKTYNFGKLDVVSAGERDPDSDDVEGMSASKMRKAAIDNDYDAFKKGLPKDMAPKEAKAIYMQLRRSMNIDEEIWQVAPKLEEENLREAYHRGEIFNVNDIVENLNTGVIGRIITRGTNYIIMVDEENRVFRNWIKDIMEKTHWEIGTDEYRKAVMSLTPGQPVVNFTKNEISLNSKKTSKKNGFK
jgi:hypothetical protein